MLIPSEKAFALSKVKTLKDGGLDVHYEVTETIGNESYTNKYHVESAKDIHPDLRDCFDRLRPIMGRIFNITSFLSMVETSDFKATKKQSELSRDFADEMLKNIEVRGVSFSGQYDNVGVVLTGLFTVFNNQKTAINSPRLKFNTETFGFEEELEAIVAERYAAKAEWAKANPELAAKMDLWFSGKAPVIDWKAIEQKPNQATRAASATVLGVLATQVENMLVSSADLSNSDKTDGFLKKTHAFVKGDFSGAFLQAGVAELTMACVCIGMSLHGGVIVACGTFFVFSDYMKPAIRMAARMEQPVKFVWSHDAFRVGEDGPTHEPVEQEVQIRLMEKLKNHKGHNSMLVLRPADVTETTIAWKMAMENTATPTALIFSRQNITNLPAGNDYSQAAKGAYIVAGSDENPDVILVASGSEVSTLVAGAELLRKDGIKLRIVSAPSEGLFRNQAPGYQESIIPANAKVFGLTAGLPVTLEGLVGAHGKVWGLESFGFSAPYKVLDEKLGFTAENVYKQVKAMM